MVICEVGTGLEEIRALVKTNAEGTRLLENWLMAWTWARKFSKVTV